MISTKVNTDRIEDKKEYVVLFVNPAIDATLEIGAVMKGRDIKANVDIITITAIYAYVDGVAVDVA